MINYYELLGMIKEGKEPKKIKAHLTSTPKIYKAQYDGKEFNYYELDDSEEEDDDYKDYLAECFLESSMFEQNIEILDEKKLPGRLNELAFNNKQFHLAHVINGIIDYLESKEEKK